MQAITSPLPCTFFFFNDTATTEIYTLSLHDALPISIRSRWTRTSGCIHRSRLDARWCASLKRCVDRKSTRLNSSHTEISYAVLCLKKKKEQQLLLAPLHPPQEHVAPEASADRDAGRE